MHDEVFATQLEADPYAFMHANGYEGPGSLEEEIGGHAAHYLLCIWDDKGLVKITHPGGGLHVRSYAKYVPRAKRTTKPDTK